eukprot:2856253-Amphidinium_carterae.2
MSVVQRKRKQRHGGGTWRAFVRLVSRGCKGTPSLLNIAQQYHEEKHAQSELYLHALDVGSVAAKTMRLEKATSKRIGAFQRKGRMLEQQRKVAMREAWVHLHDHKSDIEKAVLLAETSLCGLAPADSLAMAKACGQNMTKATNHASLIAEKTVKEFQEGHGKQFLDSLGSAAPWLCNGDNMKVIPMPPVLNVLEFKSEQIPPAVTSTCSWVTGNPQNNMGPALDKLWAEMHVTEQAIGGTRPEGGALKPSCCQEYAMCVCSGNYYLQRLKNNLLRSMKTSLGGKEQKELLAKGSVVIHFQVAGLDVPSELFLHVAFISWRPYMPTFHALTRVPAGAEKPPIEDAEAYLHLQAVWGKHLPTHCFKFASETKL